MFDVAEALPVGSKSNPKRKPLAKSPGRLAVRREEAAELIGVSVAGWDRLVSAGKTPKPIQLGGCVLWSLSKLRRWVALGCPDRTEFEARTKPTK